MLLLLAATALMLERGPVVSDVTSAGAEIRWEPAIPGAVLVVGTGGAAVEVAATDLNGVQRARAAGLAPDTRHAYRIRAPGGESEPGSFRTFPSSHDSPVSFIVTGDTRSNHTVHARMVERVMAEAPDFMVSTGDLVGDGRVSSDWDFFFEAEGALLRSTPFFPAIGNHDARGLLNETMLDRWFGRQRYYEVVAGPIIFLFVDSTLAYGSGSAQAIWLQERLDRARDAKAAGAASWIVALHHHPPFSSAHHGSIASIQRELVPMYEAAGVDLVLNGHDHVYERLESNGITYVVTGGGGAPLYEFENVLPESRVRAKAHHYLRVTADAGKLAFTAVDLDGNVLDRHELLAGEKRITPPKHLASKGRVVAASFASIVTAAAVAWVVSGRLAR